MPCHCTSMGSTSAAASCTAKASFSLRMVTNFVFLRRLISPCGHKWQCRHCFPLLQPWCFQNQAHGLQVPAACSVEPTEGASPKASKSTSETSSASAASPVESSVQRRSGLLKASLVDVGVSSWLRKIFGAEMLLGGRLKLPMMLDESSSSTWMKVFLTP